MPRSMARTRRKSVPPVTVSRPALLVDGSDAEFRGLIHDLIAYGHRLDACRDAFAAILGKDLRTELRTLRSVPAMALFAVTSFVIFRFGLDRTSLSGSLASGVLWATLLFAAVLGINRLFVAERE